MDETELQKAKSLLNKLEENSDMENLFVVELFKQLRVTIERIATNSSGPLPWTFGDLRETEQDG